MSQITNADLQPLLDLLGGGSGAGGIVTVPEPASALLLALGCLGFAVKVAIGRKSPNKNSRLRPLILAE